ncbi:hypothetical protein GCM10010377_69140 [Streptomyces viridiviolaceus]|nr:hypothetical protein GCM10010377_69140 [Streptomyces viridiviolaceus]
MKGRRVPAWISSLLREASTRSRVPSSNGNVSGGAGGYAKEAQIRRPPASSAGPCPDRSGALGPGCGEPLDGRDRSARRTRSAHV